MTSTRPFTFLTRGLCGILAAFALFLFPAFLDAAETPADALFWSRDWAGLEALHRQGDLSPREKSLVANALWFQGRWADSLALFDEIGDALPSDLHPYREMLALLGLERTGRKEEALQKGLALWEMAPDELRYYVAYALFRLEGDGDGRRGHLLNMAEAALERTQLRSALRELVALPGATVDEALRLVEIEPRHDKALKILSATDDLPPEGAFAIGYAAYLKREYNKAVDWLGKVPDSDGKGDRARFYRGYSLYRLMRDREALEVWRPLALGDGSLAKSAVRRIAVTASRSERQRALAILEEAAQGGRVAGAAALLRWADLVGGDRADALRDRLVAEYPASPEAVQVLWERGWASWKAGRPSEAFPHWFRALKASSEDRWRARLLYWIARCHLEAGRDDEAGLCHDELLRRYPLSIYTFQVFPDGGRPLMDQLPPELEGEADDLESWGFVHYARLRHLRSGLPIGQFRAARLASWLGDDRTAYLTASGLGRFLDGGAPLPVALLELLYPRPYRAEVSRAAEAYGVDPLLVWSVMRQESAFDPEATSWVGAMGLMQLMPATAKEEARLLGVESDRFYDVSVNITLGTGHLARLLRRHERLEWAVAAYNGGSGNVNRWLKGNEEAPLEQWIEEIGFDETSDYVRRVLANYIVYRKLYKGNS
ncbi:MAG: lytic transglycosylase domain-containing protein [Synergistaceae bacterium]|nr:lytic transglycosylase domain-containing protein [Synergistaceae bacterium]